MKSELVLNIQGMRQTKMKEGIERKDVRYLSTFARNI